MDARPIVLVCVSLAFADRSVSQDSIPVTSDDQQSAYIEDMAQYLSFKLSANDQFQTFAVLTPDISYQLVPNTAVKTTLAVNHRYLSASVSHAPSFLPGNNDDDRKGNTSSGGLGLAFNFERWMVGAQYSTTYGYYLSNTEEFVPGWNAASDPYIQFKDLTLREYGGVLGWKADRRFSFRALSVQTERQLRSAGSFVPSLVMRYYIVDDRTPLTGSNSSQRSDNLELLVVPGYFHTLVLRHRFYMGLGARMGGGVIRSSVLTRLPGGEFTFVQVNAVLRMEGDVALGYNGDRFFGGLQVHGNHDRFRQEGTAVVTRNDAFNWQVFLGYRFDAPGILRRGMDAVDRSAKRIQGK